MEKERMLKWFAFDHLPDDLQTYSEPFNTLATYIVQHVEPGPERTVALRKLLEGRDATLRSVQIPGG